MVLIAKLLALALTATATSVLRRDAATVDNDITQEIGPQITTLANDVNGYPASGPTGALAIHTDFQGLSATMIKATNDIQSSGSFSEDDGTTIVADLQALTSPFLGTLSAIESQTEAWKNIQGGEALVLSDLQALNATYWGFTNALLAASPSDLVPTITSWKTQIVGAFNSAIAAYSA